MSTRAPYAPAGPKMVKQSTLIVVVIIMVILLLLVTILAIFFLIKWRQTLGELENNIAPVCP